MKKLISLIKASMTEGMNLIKISSKKKGKSSIILPLILTFYLMFTIGVNASVIFSILSKNNMAHALLSVFALSISIMTFIEGVYKAGPLIFNCKDDDLLLSLPLKRRTVLFIRVFKFYVFELLFNSLFLLPIIIAYIPYGNIDISYYITSLFMLLLLPVIPIVISCIFGAIISGISSKFKYKNLIQIALTMGILLLVFYFSFNIQGIKNFLVNNVSSLNDNIIKYYYPAGVYGKLVSNFNIIDLLVFILINVLSFSIMVFIVSKLYFKVNTNLKSVKTSGKNSSKKITYKKNSVTKSLIKKELKTFFNIPVFIINSGFSLVLFIALAVILTFKFDSIIPLLEKSDMNITITKDTIINNLSIVILVLLIFTSFLTSITSSVISLEGKNINIVKSLPVKVKTILMSKIYACLSITTPVLLIGDLIMFIRFRTNILEALFLVILSILMPLSTHFIGILINLKYPKLDYESSAEVVKQSTSSFLSVMLGLILLMFLISFVVALATKLNALIILLGLTVLFIIINLILYSVLITKGVKRFKELSI